MASRRRPGALPSPSSTAPATGWPLVDPDQTGQRAALGVDHGAAKLGGEHQSAAAVSNPEPLLQLQGRDAVAMGGIRQAARNQIANDSLVRCRRVPAATEA